MKLDNTLGFYKARGLIANAQACVNLYPEKNPKDAEAPVTCYPTPGLRTLVNTGEAAPVRGLWLASNGQLYAVIGQKIFYIRQDWTTQFLGLLESERTTPVGMADNGRTLVIVDGSQNGYTITLNTNAYGSISSPYFYGADVVDYLDTYLLFNWPRTNKFYCTLSDTVDFDGLYFGAKSAYPDHISSLIVMNREVWLLGTQAATEIHSNSGSAGFPFAILPGTYIEHGCVAPFSVKKNSLMVFWVGVDSAGVGTVFMGTGRNAARISTPAIAAEWSRYPTLVDAIGMIYRLQDHVFYQVTFPSADATWVYDVSEQEWHRRTWTDGNGVERRHRANCMVYAYGKLLAGDWEVGKIYEQAQGAFTDDGVPIVRRRGYPHITQDGRLLSLKNFSANIQTGQIPGTIGEERVDGVDGVWNTGWGPGTGAFDSLQPKVWLRWSLDRGHTFLEPVAQPLGATGQFAEYPSWNNLGAGRDFVFELFWSTPTDTALNGAWVS